MDTERTAITEPARRLEVFNGQRPASRNYLEHRIMRSPAGLTRRGPELAAAVLRIILGHYLPLSIASSLSGGRNFPARRLGADVEFRASSFSVGSDRR